jgi:hypothetical protein
MEQGITDAVVEAVAFDEDTGAKVVPSLCIRQEIVQQVATPRLAPQVMVGINDRQGGFKRRLLVNRQPVGPHGGVAHWRLDRLLVQSFLPLSAFLSTLTGNQA